MSIAVFTEPFYLWREWNIANAYSHLISDVCLSSTGHNQDFIWTDSITEARCELNETEHEIASENCSCGIYGYATLQDLMIATFAGYTASPIFGLIQCYGNVFLYEHGARVQYAKPVFLFIDPDYDVKNRLFYETQLSHRYDAEIAFATPYDLYKLIKINPRCYPNALPPVDIAKIMVDSVDVNTKKLFGQIKNDQMKNFENPGENLWG